ncbi:hypothetical protein MPTK1_4g09990 [Marchantia polymorpha subsp. ruderalis]|uniref:Uncharacterized protein n=2 Tax=Marchantia polymorpha TaxID=3197 RepID=A0AAF6B8A6_MARPO|nr:hypothetical protein MARPO_0132s0042 [Marchantia polymorpha]BBN08240.1 hypothetical protein Mp_4g09990 [Marchantia polymorpha subsp. ruderalis]|eukprot:PTQ29970.1 hypothetical protein MARPO_0132s0042 [Marchantia polymorpha]
MRQSAAGHIFFFACGALEFAGHTFFFACGALEFASVITGRRLLDSMFLDRDSRRRSVKDCLSCDGDGRFRIVGISLLPAAKSV